MQSASSFDRLPFDCRALLLGCECRAFSRYADTETRWSNQNRLVDWPCTDRCAVLQPQGNGKLDERSFVGF